MTVPNERPSLQEQVEASYWLLRLLLGAGVALVGVDELTGGRGPSVIHESLPLAGRGLVGLAAFEIGAGLAVLFGPVRPATTLVATLFALTSVALLLGAASGLAFNTLLVAVGAVALGRLHEVRRRWDPAEVPPAAAPSARSVPRMRQPVPALEGREDRATASGSVAAGPFRESMRSSRG